jgi:uncharacterized protein (TIGR00730 family)
MKITIRGKLEIVEVNCTHLDPTFSRWHSASMSTIKRVCVYCGAAQGYDPAFAAAADDLGRILAALDIEIVFGGGMRGLMGRVARAAIEDGGHVTGVIPDFLEKFAEASCTRLISVSSMHSRKQTMFDLADAFIAMPGGIGTVEEVTEQMKWIQLGRHTKQIFLLNILGFWTPLISLLKSMQTAGFLDDELGSLFVVCDSTSEFRSALELNLRAEE